MLKWAHVLARDREWLNQMAIGFALLLKSRRRHHCSYVWTGALSGVVFVQAQELPGTYGLNTEFIAESLLVWVDTLQGSHLFTLIACESYERLTFVKLPSLKVIRPKRATIYLRKVANSEVCMVGPTRLSGVLSSKVFNQSLSKSAILLI